MSDRKKLWAIIPAAGIGSRMQADIPKQYLLIKNKTILQRTVERLAQSLSFEKIIIALNPEDPYWPELKAGGLSGMQNLISVDGGAQRGDSVFNGLQAIQGLADDDDWVFVHDAARPCVRSTDLKNMLQRLEQCAHGGLLALQVKDTMKRSDDQDCVSATVERDQLWHALTPQVFPFGQLMSAYRYAKEQAKVVTDEAMAMELIGAKIKLLAGSQDNIKITRPEDLKLAELYLHAQLENDY